MAYLAYEIMRPIFLLHKVGFSIEICMDVYFENPNIA